MNRTAHTPTQLSPQALSADLHDPFASSNGPVQLRPQSRMNVQMNAATVSADGPCGATSGRGPSQQAAGSTARTSTASFSVSYASQPGPSTPKQGSAHPSSVPSTVSSSRSVLETPMRSSRRTNHSAAATTVLSTRRPTTATASVTSSLDAARPQTAGAVGSAQIAGCYVHGQRRVSQPQPHHQSYQQPQYRDMYDGGAFGLDTTPSAARHRDNDSSGERSGGRAQKHPRQTSADVQHMLTAMTLRGASTGTSLQEPSMDRHSGERSPSGRPPVGGAFDGDDASVEPPAQRGSVSPTRKMRQHAQAFGGARDGSLFSSGGIGGNAASTIGNGLISTMVSQSQASQSSSYHIGPVPHHRSSVSSNFLHSNLGPPPHPSASQPYHWGALPVHCLSHEPSMLSQDEASVLFTNRLLTEFREVKELGSGYFGRVVLVEELATGQYFAVKVSSPMLNTRDEHRLKHERNILFALRGSPHCVTLHSAWVEGGTRRPQLFLQMQWYELGSVGRVASERRRQHLRWSEHEVLALLGQMATALDAIHAANIVHVDIKPDNMLIDAAGQYFLGDFGCALTLDDATGKPHSIANNFLVSNSQAVLPPASAASQTISYSQGNHSQQLFGAGCHSLSQSMASEDEGDCRYVALDMLNEKQSYKAGDIFSLGMSLYELMAGREPPRHGAPFEAIRRLTHLDELLRRGYSSGLVDVVLAMLQPDPAARPTARQLLQIPELRPSARSAEVIAHSLELLAHVPAVLPAACATSFVPHMAPCSPPMVGTAGKSNDMSPSTPLGPATGLGSAAPARRAPTVDHDLFASEERGTPVQLPPTDSPTFCVSPPLRNPFSAGPQTPSTGSSDPPTPHGSASLIAASSEGGGGLALLSAQDLTELRYHRTCMAVAAYLLDCVNKASCGVVPPARARFIQWSHFQQQRQNPRVGGSGGGSGGWAAPGGGESRENTASPACRPVTEAATPQRRMPSDQEARPRTALPGYFSAQRGRAGFETPKQDGCHKKRVTSDEASAVDAELQRLLREASRVKLETQPSSNPLVSAKGAAAHAAVLPNIVHPLKNGGGSPRDYHSAIVERRKELRHRPYTFSPTGAGPGNDIGAPPSEPFVMGSPRNHYISKTTQSTVFDHYYASEAQQTALAGPSGAGLTLSPRQHLRHRQQEGSMPPGYSHGNLAGMVHPYPSLLSSGRAQQQAGEDRLDTLRQDMVAQLRQVTDVADIDRQFEPHRDYSYAQGVKVSLPLESDTAEVRKRGKRVFEIDRDASPITDVQHQTARSVKEGAITRRRHLPAQDRLSLRLTKKQNLQEDTSIFSPRNRLLRAGLQSVETKGSRYELRGTTDNFPLATSAAHTSSARRDYAPNPPAGPRSGPAPTAKAVVLSHYIQAVAPATAATAGGGGSPRAGREVHNHAGKVLSGTPRALPTAHDRLARTLLV